MAASHSPLKARSIRRRVWAICFRPSALLPLTVHSWLHTAAVLSLSMAFWRSRMSSSFFW